MARSVRSKKSSAAARGQAPDFKGFFEKAPGLFLVLDPKFRIVAASDAYLSATLTRRADILGRNIFSVFPDNPADNKASAVGALRDSLGRVLITKEPDAMSVQQHDISRLPKQGGGFEQRWWSVLNVPVVERGRVHYIIQRVNDVTQAVRAMQQRASKKSAIKIGSRVSSKEWELVSELILKETEAINALRRKEGEFQNIVNSLPLLSWTADATGFIYWYNARWYEYTGTTPQQMEGWGWQSVHDPVMLPVVLERWKASIATGEPFEMEFPLRSAQGLFRWFLTRVVPVRDEQNRIVQWFGTNTDVNDIRLTQNRLRDSENRLRLSEERLRLAQKAARIGSWEFDIDRDEYFWTEEASEILGRSVTLRRVAEKDFFAMMYVAADREIAARAMRAAVSKKREYDISFRVRKADGEFRWIAARGTPFFNQGKNVMIGVFIDITDARQAKPELAS